MAETLYFDNNRKQSSPGDAVYRLDIWDRKSIGASPAQWSNVARVIRTANTSLCKGNISRGFFQDEKVDETDIVFALYFIGDTETTRAVAPPNPKTGGTLSGFVMVDKLKDGTGTYYIDAICADLKRGSNEQKRRLGTLLVSQVENYVSRNGGEAVKLSALGYVIGYYRKLGYRHIQSCPPGATDVPEHPVIKKAAEESLSLKFETDGHLDLALRAELAKKNSKKMQSRRLEQKELVNGLYDYFEHEYKFEIVNGEVVALEGEDIEKINKLVRTDNSAILRLLTYLRNANFAVNCGPGAPKDDFKTKDARGNYEFHCNDEGFTMMKCLDKPSRPENVRPTKRMRVITGGTKNNLGKIYKMAGKTRKAVPWKGWGKIAPRGRQRTVMKRICGKKCFLGPGKSFPVCAKGTCKVNKKGLYAAYVRSRQWGSKRSHYKGKARPTHRRSVYKKVARKSRRMLRRRGVRVGDTRRRRRR
jgi:hypothetical protein